MKKLINIKLQHIIYLVAFLVFITCFIIGSFYDLEIDNAIYQPRNAFGITMAALGEIPAYGGFSMLGFGIIYYSYKNIKIKYQCYLLILLGLISITAGMYFQSTAFVSHNALNIQSQWYYGVLFASVTCGICGYFGYRLVKSSDNENILKNMIVMLLSIAIILILLTIIKSIASRPRYRFLNEYSEFFEFRNWWQGGGDLKSIWVGIDNITSDEFKSFPSGHTCSAAVSMILLPSISLFNSKYRRFNIPLFVLGFIWTCIVAYSRLTLGAHFLTDVSFGAILMMIAFFTSNYIVYRINRKEIKNEIN